MSEGDESRLRAVVGDAHQPRLQLSGRALATGALLGAATGVSNLYVGLKIGWSLGVVVTASIVGWAVWRGFVRTKVWRQMPTILEANAMASTASAAGHSTGATLVSAIAALWMVTGEALPLGWTMAWLLMVGTLGVLIAAWLKRSLIDTEQLAFPTGVAAAEALDGLYRSTGTRSGQARALGIALMVGLTIELLTSVTPFAIEAGVVPWWLGVPTALPPQWLQQMIPWLGVLVAYGWELEVSLLVPAAGVLVQWRVVWSLLLGALVCFGLLAPQLRSAEIIGSTRYFDVVGWSVWPGATLMVFAGMIGVIGRGRQVRATFTEVPSARRVETRRADAVPEIPRRWIGGGLVVVAAGCVGLQWWLFAIPIVVAVGAVGLAAGLAIVAARVTGQTDVTPVGPLGKIAQLVGGVVLPGQVGPTLMCASVTAGAAASAADLLTDFKCGHRLGADPRQQFLAQLAGVFVGVVVTVPVFHYVLVPDPSRLGTDQWPAPAAQVWASVSVLVGQGVTAVPTWGWWSMAVAASVATIVGILEQVRPTWCSRLPSATGLGLAFVLPAGTSLGFFVGGLVAWVGARRYPGVMKAYAVPIAAGLIAGESLMGVVSALLMGWIG